MMCYQVLFLLCFIIRIMYVVFFFFIFYNIEVYRLVKDKVDLNQYNRYVIKYF